MPFAKDGTFFLEAGCVATEGGAVHLGGGRCRCFLAQTELRVRTGGGPYVRVRDRINSVAGSMDEAHGRPFVLGRAERIPRFALDWSRGGDPSLHQVGIARRVWIADVLMPDGTWRSGYALMDAEVFEPIEISELARETFLRLGVIA